jgi:GT2 family glycosyltransferase
VRWHVSSGGKLGVVTVTYNSTLVLDAFLESVSAQTQKDFLLYAVDNASRDDTLEKLAEWGDDRLRVIANRENVGIAEANNQGAQAALVDGCDLVLFMNNDIEFEPETFATLRAELDALQCDLLGPKILFEDGVHVWSAGGGFNKMKGYLSYHIGEGEVDMGQFESARVTDHSPACCLLVRPSVFQAIGFFDAKYFVYWDDSDFNYRALLAGFRMFYTPRARILHKVSSLTGGATSTFTVRYNTRGHVYFMLKNLGVLRALYYLPALEVRLIYKLISRSISWAGYVTRQRAMIEGVGVWLS